MHAELGILVGKYRRLRSPESVSRLLAMLRVGSAEFARLHHKCDQARCQCQEKNGIAKAAPKRMDGHRCSPIIGESAPSGRSRVALSADGAMVVHVRLPQQKQQMC